jgi:Pla-1/cef family extracellular lipase
MKKLVLSVAIASIIGLTACEDESIKDVQKEVVDNGSAVMPSARVVFNPSAGVLSVPNDLLFSGTTDGTLNMPGEKDAEGNALLMPDYSDPSTALGSNDGWSIAQPFVLNFDFPAGSSLDGSSLLNTNSVRIFEAMMGGDTTDANCATLTRGLACKIVSELTFGPTGDFVTQKSGNSIVVVPVKPLKAKTTYILALTDSLQDSEGKAVAASTTYELVQQDITTLPLGNAAQLGLQAVINSFETAVSSAGVEKSSIIYTMAMTTQSTTDALDSVKSLLAANAQLGSVPTIGIQDTGASVADILGDNIPDSSKPLYSAANYMRGSVTLPYFIGIPSMANPTAPATGRMRALCDSGAMLAGLAAVNPAAIPADVIAGSVSDATCMAISEAKGLPYPGLRDLSSLFPLDTQRHLTKFNPVPAASAASDMPWIGDPGKIDVQLTTPDLPVVNAVRAAMGLEALTKPENGWPVVILQHGITSQKEHMLPLTGALAINGLATVAIDLPLHGSRGFDLNFDGTDDISASISAIHYANLASLPTFRDNFRQSTADMLGLRFALNFMGGVDPVGNPIDLELDSSKVHFSGLSLGAMMGINFVAMANTSLNPAIDGMFKVSAASYASPGVMFANVGMDSPAFASLAKSNLAYQASPDFKALVDSMFPLDDSGNSTASADQLTGVYNQFYAALTSEQKTGLQGVFAQFTFAAQTVSDSGDPISYIGRLAASQTPIHLMEIVGNGVDNMSDQVVTNTTPYTPLGGTEPTIALLGLAAISETTMDFENKLSGAVRFLYGHHSSVINPAHTDGITASAQFAGRTTVEMQTQVATFLATEGAVISVTDKELVAQ